MAFFILISAQPGPCEQYPGYSMTQWGCLIPYKGGDFCTASKTCSFEGARLMSTDSITTKDGCKALITRKYFNLHYIVMHNI